MYMNDTHIEAGQAMSPKARQAFYSAIIEYTALGVEPQGLPREAQAAWLIAKKDIDNAAVKAEAGSKGAAARQANRKQSNDLLASNDEATIQANAKQPSKDATKQTPSNPASKPPSKTLLIEKEIEIEKITPIGVIEKNRPPETDPGPSYSIEEVRAAFMAAGFGDRNPQVEAFFDHYAAQGWVFGNGRPMVNLPAAVGKWMRDKPQWAARGGDLDGIDILE